MINSDLIKQLQGFGKDADMMLIEFPNECGPYRSPGDLVPLIGTYDTIIETVHPRNGMTVRDLFIKLQGHPLDGRVQLFLNQGGSHPIAYYDIGSVHLRSPAGVVITADGIIAT
jgi:hypothetical protein